MLTFGSEEYVHYRGYSGGSTGFTMSKHVKLMLSHVHFIVCQLHFNESE